MANATVQTQGIRNAVRWSSGANAVLGVWLFFAPFILGYSGLTPALWNDMIVGAAIFFLAVGRTASPLRNEGVSWANAGLGAWLVLAPFILAYNTLGVGDAAATAAWNDVIVGLIVAVLAVRSATASRRAATKPVE